ncbi:MAG: hypothetical protein IPQ07_34500 [Myxococcales bacterium]|nr:hypothetical protein [Myxococcales bacterium]
MPTEHKVTRTEVTERYFTCPRCNAKGEVEFHAVGEGGWVRESWWSSSSAVERSAQQAADDLMVDADRVARMIRCPACELRPPGALRWALLRVLAPLAVGALAAVVGGEGWIVAIGMGVMALWLGYRELQRLRRADRAEILKLEYPKDALPVARATPVPKRAPPPTPLVPVPSVAPAIEKPRGPDEGPAFLKRDD